jgi:hypothetical protein
MKKHTTLVTFLYLLPIVLSPVVIGDITQIYRTTSEYQDAEYWAVIVGIANYKGIKNDLPVTEKHMRLIYDVLLSKPNWDVNHIKLLLNEDADRNSILDALDWLANNVDSNDTVLFSYQGHGSSIEDNDGDEQDGKDEGIVPWEGLEGIITDDELDDKFDLMNCSGMMLIFHSCLSGGLIDISQRHIVFNLSRQFSAAFITDIEGTGRVILMSSMDQGLALAYPSLTRQIAFGLNGEADDDLMGDPGYGVVTAEEASIYASQQVKKLFFLIFLLYPFGLINFLLASLLAKIRYGYWVLPFPQLYDGFNGELLIIEIL